MLLASVRATFPTRCLCLHLSAVCSTLPASMQEVFSVICTRWTLTAYFAVYPDPGLRVFEI